MGLVPGGALLLMTAELAFPVLELGQPSAQMLVETPDPAEFGPAGLDVGAACQTCEAVCSQRR